MLYDLPYELEILDLLFGRLGLGYALVSGYRNNSEILVLEQKAAVDGNEGMLLLYGVVHVDLEYAEILLGPQKLKSIGSERRSHDNFEEDGLQELCNLEVDLTVECNDAAEDGGLVAFIYLLPCFYDILSGAASAGIHVLHADGERNIREVTDNVQGSVGILDIVVG